MQGAEPTETTPRPPGIDAALQRHERLRKRGGKEVYELQPDVDWDKGAAVLCVLRALGCDGDDVLPICIGDDLTDEDALSPTRDSNPARRFHASPAHTR